MGVGWFSHTAKRYWVDVDIAVDVATLKYMFNQLKIYLVELKPMWTWKRLT